MVASAYAGSCGPGTNGGVSPRILLANSRGNT